MAQKGRPRRITDEMIVAAGARIGLSKLTVHGVASSLDVSEMTIYRRVGSLEQLRSFVMDGIISSQNFFLPGAEQPEDALLKFASQLRKFVCEFPGIATYLTDLGEGAPLTMKSIEESQRAFAARFGWSAAHTSILVSVVAEHAVALAELNPISYQRSRRPERLPEGVEVVRSGAELAAGVTPGERFEWSMRATIRGAMGLLGIALPDSETPAQTATVEPEAASTLRS